jgi:hypothetical protein
MFQILLLNLFLTLPILAHAQDAVPQSNGDCPVGYRSSGDFCTPLNIGKLGEDGVIEKRGNSCPPGYRNSGDGHCRQFANSDIHALPKSGRDCPTGYRSSGDYCSPFQSSRPNDDYIIEKVGSRCPSTYISDNGYCKRNPKVPYEAVPRKPGAKCPYAWRADGDYCVNR